MKESELPAVVAVIAVMGCIQIFKKHPLNFKNFSERDNKATVLISWSLAFIIIVGLPLLIWLQLR